MIEKNLINNLILFTNISVLYMLICYYSGQKIRDDAKAVKLRFETCVHWDNNME